MKLSHFFTLAALTLASGMTLAAEIQTYSQSTFDTLNKQGKPIVVDVFATWCPVCKTQEPIIEKLLQQPEFKDINVLRVDFDKEKETLKQFHVATQSTLVGFKDGKEVGRSVGDTTEEGIKSLFEKVAK